MELILKKNKAIRFLSAMAVLEQKFDNIYFKGSLSDFVKIDIVDNKIELIVDRKLPEMVRVASYMVFVETLL